MDGKKQYIRNDGAEYRPGIGWMLPKDDNGPEVFLGSNYKDAYDRICDLNEKADHPDPTHQNPAG